VRFGGQFGNRVDAVEQKLKVNSGFIRDTNVTFGTFTGTDEIRWRCRPTLPGRPPRM